MALPVAIIVAVEVIEKAVKVAEAVQKIVGLFSPPPADRTAEIVRKIDAITADISRLRDEMRELGQRILQEIERSRLTIQLFELNRMVSLAESALHSLQTSRLTNSQILRDAAIRDSDLAVTELKNAQQFADRAAAIGPFMFVVNARLQIMAELASASFSDAAFRSQIDNWVDIVRNAASVFEAEIRSANQRRYKRKSSVVGRERHCYFDIESRKVVCEWVGEGHERVTVAYSNISETVTYVSDSDDPNVGRNQPFRTSTEARDRGLLDDLELLGVNKMRKLANTWEATRRISLFPPIWIRLLGRAVTETELLVISEASERGELDAERIVRGVLMTDEFLGTVTPSQDEPQTQQIVTSVFEKVTGRRPEPEEAKLHVSLHDTLGYGSFVSAISSLALPADETPIGERTRPAGSNTLDVLRRA